MHGYGHGHDWFHRMHETIGMGFCTECGTECTTPKLMQQNGLCGHCATIALVTTFEPSEELIAALHAALGESE